MIRTSSLVLLVVCASTLTACGDWRKKTGPTALSLASYGKKSDTLGDGRKCTSDLEGYGQCNSGAEIAFCKSGSWITLNCSDLAAEEGADGSCKEDDKAKSVDCKIEGGEEEGEGEGEEGGF